MNWTEVNAAVEAAFRIIVLTHVSPDGDAIGTLLGLRHALTERGKYVIAAVDEGVPGYLRFLPGAERVLENLNGIEQADLVIVVDCGDEARVGKVGEQARLLNKMWINIDHHWSNPRFADLNLIDAEWVSASEAVFDWLTQDGGTLSANTAQCLMTGLITDTLCFRTDSTKPTTLGKAQRLMECGADLSQIVQRTVSRMATSSLYLWAQVLPTFQLEDGVIWASISHDAKKLAAANAKTSERIKDGAMSSLLVQADEARIACVLTEKDEGKVELSLRAKPGLDTSTVAVAFGGGGHKLASGATTEGTLSEIEARVIPMLKALVKASDATS